MAKTAKEMTGVMAKFENGKLVLTIPVEKLIESDAGELSSTGKSYLLATTHGSQPIVKLPGVSFALNVTMKKDSYDRIHTARRLLNEQNQPAPTQPAGGMLDKLATMTPEQLAKLEKLLALI